MRVWARLLVCVSLCGVVVAPAAAVVADTIDGLFNGVGPVAGGSSVDLTVVGRGGVPSTGVGSVALNVTVTNPVVAGFVTVWPAGVARPNASNLNFVAGLTVPNMVIVPVGSGGKVSMFASSTVDVIVDVLGWFAPAGFAGLTPARLMDTRVDSPTVDGVSAGAGVVAGLTSVDLSVVGRGGVPSAGVGSVALNVTVANPNLPGFVTVWPAGVPRPNASNLNFVAGQTVPNMVIVPVGASGKVSMFASSTTDVIVDVLGWFEPSGFAGLTPARLMDTRAGSSTVDGAFAAGGLVKGPTSVDLTVVGRGGVPPTGVGSVALNVTVTNPFVAGFVTVWPAGGVRPNASNLNFVGGQTVPNMVLVPVGVDGRISLFVSSPVDVVVDVLGFVPAGGGFAGLSPARLMDTRPAPPALPGTNFALPVGAIGPSGIAFDGTNIWTANYNTNNVSRINAATGVGFNFALPAGASRPFGIVFDGTNIWTTNFNSNDVSRIDAATGVGTNFALPAGATNPQGITFDGSNIWTTNFGTRSVSRINAATGVGTDFALPVGVGSSRPQGITFDGANIWTTNRTNASVTRINPATGAGTIIALPTGANNVLGIVSDGTNIWTTNSVSKSVSRINLATGAGTNFALPEGAIGPDGIVFDGTNVWTTNSGSHNVSRINPTSGEATNFALPAGATEPHAIVFDGTNIWTANQSSSNVTKLSR